MGYFERLFETVLSTRDYEPDVGIIPKIGRTELENGCIVDTCDTPDCGLETGVAFPNNDWVIVQYYNSEEEAKKGHDFWCEFCKHNPVKLYSVQLNRFIEIDYDE